MAHTRYAEVLGTPNEPNKAERVARYLPGNYTVAYVGEHVIGIMGTDVAGWTLDDYVIPRLGSGCIGCREVHNPAWAAIPRGRAATRHEWSAAHPQGCTC